MATDCVCHCQIRDYSRKRVVGIMAAILASLHMQSADDVSGGTRTHSKPGTERILAKNYYSLTTVVGFQVGISGQREPLRQPQVIQNTEEGWCREGEFIFGDLIFPITLAKQPRSSGLANERTLLICPI